MRRVEVSRALGAVAEVRASIRAHRGRVTPKLDARQPSPAGEDPLFSYQGYFDHMDAELAHVEDKVTVAEDVHVHKLTEIVQVRRQKEEQTSTVYNKQTAARQLLAGYHGEKHGFEVAAVSGPTPRLSQTLAEQVDLTTKMLRNPGEPLPGRIAGVNLDFEAMAQDLEKDHGVLVALREYYARTRKEADGTRQIVNAALDELKGVFPWVARSLEASFRLVGERELADRIRTSRRRVTRRQRDDEKTAKDGEPAPNDGSTTEETASPPAEVAETAPPPAES